MNIIVHDYAGHPFEVDLSRGLAAHGHQVVHLYAGYNQTPKGSLIKKTNDPANFQVFPIYIREPLKKYSFFKRWLQEREYGLLLSEQILRWKPDWVISACTPLDAQASSLQAARQVGAGYIHWMQDATGVATWRVLSKRIPVIGSWIGKYYIHKEKLISCRCDAVVAITPDFVPLLKEWNVPERKIKVIPNWAPLNELPVRPKQNAWSESHGLNDQFVFLYTGSLGLKHNPDLLLQLAIRVQDQNHVAVVVVSEGPGAEWLKQRKQELHLENLFIFGYQPMAQLPDVLGTGDVLIAILEPDAGVFSVPSKVLSYHCAARPLLLAVPFENLASRIVMDHQTGVVVDPNDPRGFVAVAESLLMDLDRQRLYAHNARQYAEQNFKLGPITDQFESIFGCKHR